MFDKINSVRLQEIMKHLFFTVFHITMKSTMQMKVMYHSNTWYLNDDLHTNTCCVCLRNMLLVQDVVVLYHNTDSEYPQRKSWYYYGN